MKLHVRPVFLSALVAVWVVCSAAHGGGTADVPRAAATASAELKPGAPLAWTPPAGLAGSAIFPAEEQFVDLCAALRLAEVQNPSIGLARQAIQEALAEQLRARSLLLPSVNAGGNYRNHQGILQTSAGRMIDVDSSSLYLGNGALADAAGSTVVPGVQLFAHLGDGLFEPLAARQLVASRSFQAQATSNQVLLEVSRRFLDLARAEGELWALRQSEVDVDQAVRLTRDFARVKQGRHADEMRASTTALLLHSQEVHAEEILLTASAELARVLSVDPAVRLRARPDPAALFELVDVRRELEELVRLARDARPEMAALSAEVSRKQIQVRQERTRPLFPTVSLGFSAGSFGGGTSPAFGQFNNRTDVDLVAYWTLQNMGLGNWALQKERLSQEREAALERERMANVINHEVADAQALVIARRQDVDIAGARLGTAAAGFREDLLRIKGLVGLPIELLNSLNRLVGARVDFVQVVQDYNLAQMQLFVALGATPLAAAVRPQR